MTELEASPNLIAQTGADALLRQLTAGLLTPDEYHAAIALVAPMQEEGKRCVYCGKQAHIGNTCASHANLADVMNAVRATRPLVDQSLCTTMERSITIVMTALETNGREEFAGRFAERAEKAENMNALHMIIREYVRLENLLGRSQA